MLENLNNLDILVSRCLMFLRYFNNLNVLKGYNVLDRVGLLDKLTVLSTCRIVPISNIFEDSDMLGSFKMLSSVKVLGYFDVLLDDLNSLDLLVLSQDNCFEVLNSLKYMISYFSQTG